MYLLKIKLLIIPLILLSSFGHTQKQTIGVGLFGLINRNINFSFERKVNDHFAGKIGVGLLIPGKLPHLDIIINTLSDSDTEGYFEQALKNINFSAYSITPEIHYYFKKNGLKGFYIGPYARYARYIFSSSYNSDVSYYDANGNPDSEKNVVFDLKGRIQKTGAGIIIGYQKIINDKFFIDFSLIGPGLMHVNAKTNVSSPNFPSEESISEFIKDELNVIPEIFGEIEVEAISDTEAQGKWVRILPTYRCNISIGFVF